MSAKMDTAQPGRRQTTEAAVQESEAAERKVRSLWIPLTGNALLIPNTVVAEVTESESPRPVSHAPNWLLGMISWRGRSIPVISFERLLGGEPGAVNNGRIVVLNTLNGNTEVPFLALMASGIPRLTQVSEAMLEAVPGHSEQDGPVLCTARFEGIEIMIPDIDMLEKMLLHLGIRVR